MTRNVFILGAGYSARAFALARPESPVAIAGTARSAGRFASLRAAGIEPFLFDGEASSRMKARLGQADAIIVSIPPDERGDPALRLLRDFPCHVPGTGWIGYLSTVGVYGDHGGGWVDETGPCRAVSRRAVLRLEAERQWLELGRRAGIPVAVLRLSGIYGPGRNAFVSLADGTARRLLKPGQVFNRIHVRDIAGALWHLAGRRLAGIFNVTDDLPAPPQDVVAHAASIAGVEAPALTDFATAALPPSVRSFYVENKRVSNAALKASGYNLCFPDYRAALGAMWAEGNWAGSGAADQRSPMRQS